MSVRRFDLEAGGDQFAFEPETENKISFWLGKYPDDRKRSAVIPLLWLAQKDNSGWLSEPAMREVADLLDMPYIRVYEVATFYTMFNLKPVGRHHVQLCGTTPCMLRGANDLKEVCKRHIGKAGSVSESGRLSWVEVECLGACVNAPMAQINDYYYEDLTAESFETILGKLENGVSVEPGTFVDRHRSAPQGEAKTLIDATLYDGSATSNVVALPNRPDTLPETELKNGAIKPQHAQPVTEAVAVEEVKPEALDAPEGGQADDLKRINGIGGVLEAKLNELGIFHFSQIASWGRSEVAWVDSFLSFKGRIDREQWIPQAKVLAGGA